MLNYDSIRGCIWVKKKVIGLTFTFALLFSAVAGLLLINLATANPYEHLSLFRISINSDGTITPQTQYISRNGNAYTLTADIIQEYSIEISCSNIVFDGAGHTINVSKAGKINEQGSLQLYTDVGLNLVDVTNVTVKNVKVYGNNPNNINLQFSSNCQITGVTTGKDIRILGDFNTITESNTGIDVFTGSNNLITRNNINDVFVGSDCYSNKFFKNNFFLSDYPDFFSESVWDNGSVGNYWSNYTIKYPNALEVGNSGIGDMPYFIERAYYTTKEYPNVKNIDYYPLMYPCGAPELTMFKAENATYAQSYPLNFTVNKQTQWMGYSLDGEANVTVTSNITLNGLASGFHNVTIYATDVYGVGGASKTSYFKVVEPFPTVLVAGASATLVAVVTVSLFYCNKKRHN